jgi:hypothetical protein
MGVHKFHSVEEMPGPAPLPRLAAENLRIACGLSTLERWHGLRPRQPGVQKFRSWSELLAMRDAEPISWLCDGRECSTGR